MSNRGVKLPENLKSKSTNPDMQAAPYALLRAARRAREIALQTNTPIVIRRDGVLVEEWVTEADLKAWDDEYGQEP